MNDKGVCRTAPSTPGLVKFKPSAKKLEQKCFIYRYNDFPAILHGKCASAVATQYN